MSEMHLPEEDIYYIITCYKEGVTYPNYLANYDLSIHKPLVIQSGIYDAVKFEETLSPTLFMNRAEKLFGDTYEFELSMVSKNVFGKGIARFVYELGKHD